MDISKIIFISYCIMMVSSIDTKYLVSDTPPIQIPICHSEPVLQSCIQAECEYKISKLCIQHSSIWTINSCIFYSVMILQSFPYFEHEY